MSQRDKSNMLPLYQNQNFIIGKKNDFEIEETQNCNAPMFKIGV